MLYYMLHACASRPGERRAYGYRTCLVLTTNPSTGSSEKQGLLGWEWGLDQRALQ